MSAPTGSPAASGVPRALVVCVALLLALVALAAGLGSAAAPTAGAGLDDTVRALLARRSAAVRDRDLMAWQATQTGPAQASSFAALTTLPFTRFEYRLRGAASTGPDTALAAVVLTSELVDDSAPTEVEETLALRRSGLGWAVSAEDAVDGRLALWDLAPLAVAQGTRVLVVGADAPGAPLDDYARLADRIVPQVSEVWGTGWAQRVVVVLPGDDADLARALGGTTTLVDGVAAVTERAASDGAAPDRVWLRASVLARLSETGREVVLRHELTHVATASTSARSVPLWLAEGIAEWVGYRGSGIPLQVAVGDLLDATRAGAVGTPFPDPAALRGAEGALAYESAHLACALVAERAGTAGLVRFYRLVAQGRGTPRELAAVRAVTGWSPAELAAQWHRRVAAMAATAAG